MIPITLSSFGIASLFAHGIFRITAAAPALSIANPAANVAASLRVIEESDADLVLLPELGLTGYTCGDLFAADALIHGATAALLNLALQTRDRNAMIVVGLPLVVADSLMNCAAVVAGGHVRGVVPKSFLPNYREFYEARHFRAASMTDPQTIRLGESDVPFGTDLLFRWRRELEAEGKAFPGSGVARDQELLALKRELAKVKRERDFLRDAAAFFASESK